MVLEQVRHLELFCEEVGDIGFEWRNSHAQSTVLESISRRLDDPALIRRRAIDVFQQMYFVFPIGFQPQR